MNTAIAPISLVQSRMPYMIGVHGPDTALAGGKEVRPYVAYALDAYLRALGADPLRPLDARGAVAHVKIRDEGGRWRRGKAPDIAPSVKVFLEDAKRLGFRTVVAWVPHGAWEPQSFGPATPADGKAIANAAESLERTLGDRVDAYIFGNEQEALLGDVRTSREDEAYFRAEAIAGRTWASRHKFWIAGADMSVQNLVDSLPARVRAWSLEIGKDIPLHGLAEHLYGEGGDQPEHLEPMQRAVKAKLSYLPQIIATEWAIGFEGVGVPRGSKTFVHDGRARAFNAAFATELGARQIAGCYFTQRELQDESGALTEAGRGLKDALWAPAGTVFEAPVMQPRKAMLKGMRLEAEAKEAA